MDGNPNNIGPKFNNRPYVVYFFVVFIMIGSVLCINLYIANLQSSFLAYQNKNKYDLSKDQL